jgi:undecaprenyl diphosphate synthase
MHLGIIPDGHRRYARNNNISEKRSYLKSQELIDDIIERTSDSSDIFNTGINIDEVTVYAMSEENLKRDEQELQVFYDALVHYFDYLMGDSELKYAFANSSGIKPENINVKIVSTARNKIPPRVMKKADQIENKFNGDKCQLNILLSYNGRKEILQSVSNIKEGDLSIDVIEDELQISSEISYVIRTGDNPTRECLSGFPIWQSSYAEYYHVKKNFPAIKSSDFKNAIEHYNKLRKKRGE